MGHAIDARERRSFFTQTAAKRFHSFRRPLDLNGDAAGVVADEASEMLLRCKPVNKRPKTNSLHHTAHQQQHTLERFYFCRIIEIRVLHCSQRIAYERLRFQRLRPVELNWSEFAPGNQMAARFFQQSGRAKMCGAQARSHGGQFFALIAKMMVKLSKIIPRAASVALAENIRG